MDLIEIFKIGTHTDSAGKTREWTDKDLEEIASLYNPEINEAPIVIGHPDHDSPAYGWVESLKVDGGKLLAKVKDVAEEFKDWVRRGLYKKVSIALYPDLGLRHVGFLGATPPAVKGLKQATFGEKPAAWKIETEFRYMEYWQQETVKNIFGRIRDWMIDKFGLEEADKVIPSFEIDALKPEPKETAAVPVPQYSERDSNKGGKTMDVSKFFTDLKALVIGGEKELVTPDPGGAKFTEAEVQAKVNAEKEKAYAEAAKERKEKVEFQEKLRTIETKARKDEIHTFCEGLAKEGKLIPAWQKMGIEEFLFSLDNSQPMQFASPPAEALVQARWFKDFITELPKVVTFREVAGGDGPNTGGSAAEKLSALVKQKMETKKDLFYGAAFAEVQKENPELAREMLDQMKGDREKK